MHEAQLALGEATVKRLPFVCVLNYESAWREPMAAWLLKQEWDLVVLDESHRCSSPQAKCSRYVAKLGKVVPHRLCLTGTPMSSSPLSVFGQYRFLAPTIFGTRYEDFKKHYAIMGGFENRQVVRYQNQEELQEKFYSIAFRVETRDVLSLPEELHVRRLCRLSPAARRHYKELEDEFYTQLATGEVSVQNALVKLLRLQQATSGYLKQDTGEEVDVDTGKRDLLEDIMLDLHHREPLVIFARFTYDLATVRNLCRKHDRRYSELSGRADNLKEWQDGKADVIGVNIRSGGAGITLVRARYCVYYSIGFSLGDWLQSVRRLVRPGQHHNCTFYHLVAEKTVDERIYDCLQKKEDAVQTILKWRKQ